MSAQLYVSWFNRIFSPVFFRPCYLGYGFNRLCLENSLGGEVHPQRHPCINVGVLSHILIFHFVICLLEGSLESHQSSLLIFPCSRCHIKEGSYSYFFTRWWCIENSLRNWLSTENVERQGKRLSWIRNRSHGFWETLSIENNLSKWFLKLYVQI